MTDDSPQPRDTGKVSTFTEWRWPIVVVVVATTIKDHKEVVHKEVAKVWPGFKTMSEVVSVVVVVNVWPCKAI